jgi:hypothetical protein
MRTKGLFVTFYNEVLNVEDVKKYNIFNYTKRQYAIRCNSLEEQNEVMRDIISMDGIKNVRYAKSVDVSIFDVVEYKRYKMNEQFMWEKELPMTDKEVYEWCPNCECEVIIKADCTIMQVCPTCGKPIIACSMCETMDCNNCPLNKKAKSKTRLYVKKMI